MNVNRLKFRLFEFRVRRLLHKYVAFKNRILLHKISDYLTSFDFLENISEELSPRPSVVVVGWASRPFSHSINKRDLEALNPGFRVSVNKFPRRELLRHSRHFGLFPGFRVVAEVISGNSHLKPESFVFGKLLLSGQVAVPLASNADAKYILSMMGNEEESKPLQNYSASDSVAYVDRIIFQERVPHRGHNNWFSIFVQRNPELVLKFLDTPVGEPWISAAQFALKQFVLDSRMFDRVTLLKATDEMVTSSDLECFRIRRDFVPVLGTSELCYPELVSADNIVTAVPGTRPIMSVPAGWLKIRKAELHRAAMITVDNELINYEHAADPHSEFVSGLWRHVYGSALNPNFALVDVGEFAETEAKEVILIGGRNDSNWYHFVVEYLPRILNIPSDINPDIPVVVSSSVPQSALHLLTALTDRRILQLDPERRYRFDQVHIAAPVAQILDSTEIPWNEGLFINRPALLAFREAGLELVQHARSKFPRKVFLARKSAHRGLLNEDELSNIARSQGFTVVDPMKLGPFEQIALFAQADVVIGASGAVMANYLFMKPTARVIALTSTMLQDFVLPAVLAGIAGSSFTYILGKPVTDFSARKTSESRMHSDFIVSEALFRSYISQVNKSLTGL